MPYDIVLLGKPPTSCYAIQGLLQTHELYWDTVHGDSTLFFLIKGFPFFSVTISGSTRPCCISNEMQHFGICVVIHYNFLAEWDSSLPQKARIPAETLRAIGQNRGLGWCFAA